jgi:hypothetical protein
MALEKVFETMLNLEIKSALFGLLGPDHVIVDDSCETQVLKILEEICKAVSWDLGQFLVHYCRKVVNNSHRVLPHRTDVTEGRYIFTTN